jgi:nucleoside 2-deoxyribosyltransferase
MRTPIRTFPPARFYLASGLPNAERAKSFIAALEDKGYVNTYNWATHGSLQSAPELWNEVAQKEVQGVRSADFLVVLVPGGRGTHVEIGIALGLDFPIYLVAESAEQLDTGSQYTCIFYNHPNITKLFAPKDDQLAKLCTVLQRRGEFEAGGVTP